MKPIEFLNLNQKAKIKEIRGGKSFLKQIQNIGLRKGDEVQMIQNRNYGPIIIKKDEFRVALGRGMAHKIMVDALD